MMVEGWMTVFGAVLVKVDDWMELRSILMIGL